MGVPVLRDTNRFGPQNHTHFFFFYRGSSLLAVHKAARLPNYALCVETKKGIRTRCMVYTDNLAHTRLYLKVPGLSHNEITTITKNTH
jgi:hypothetical protein